MSNIKKRIGLILGSFNPIHIGHLHMATSVLNKGLVDEVIFVPAFQNPWKQPYKVAYCHRCTMVCLAIEPIKGCYISYIENEGRYTYSYEVLEDLLKLYPNVQLCLIVGEDTAQNIRKWQQGEWIVEKFPLIILARPTYYTYEMPDITEWFDISSTQIRNLIKQNKQIYPLVTKEVDEYIKTWNLYE